MRHLSISLAIAISLALGCSSSSNGGGTSNDAGANAADASGTSDAAASATFTDVYTKVIAPNCAPCHTSAGGEGVMFGKLDMTSQAVAYTNLVNAAAAGDQCAGKGTRVVPNMPDSSVFYLKISLDDPAPCGEKMPLGGAALSKDNVALVESWINGGAKND